MSYSWTDVITAGATISKATHHVELHTNIDDVRSKVGLAGYAWSKTPSQYTDKIESIDYTQIRTALDDAKDENYCHTHNATHYPGYLNDDHGTYQSGYDAGQDAALNVTHLNNDHVTHLSGHDTGQDATHYPGYLNDDNGTYYSGYDAGQDAAHYPGYLSDHHGTYYGSHLVGYDAAHYPGYLNDYHGSYYVTKLSSNRISVK